jgi:pimeloyl-ACP methyl ester carboxylesterase
MISTDPSSVIDAGGYRVRTIARGEGPALLMCNGLASPIERWRPFVHGFGDFRVITCDMPGVGKSQTPSVPLTVNQVSKIAVEVLDHYGVERAHVLGYSHGGAVAQQLALDSPERVDRLVLVATTCGIGAVLPDPITLAVYGWAHWTHAIAETPWGVVGLLWQLAAIGSWSSLPRLAQITAPTLVIAGETDSLVPVANAQFLSRRIPGARLQVIAGAGHDLLLGAGHEGVAESVREFLLPRDG